MQPLAAFVKRAGDIMSGKLTVNKQVENTADGYKFPDGSVQLTANARVEYEAQADADIKAGQVLNLKGSGHVGLARADALATANISGLAKADCLATFSCVFISDSALTLEDWTEIVGSAELTVGTIYYLDPSVAGHLTTTAPTTIGQYVIKIGMAIAVDTLDIEIGQKILI